MTGPEVNISVDEIVLNGLSVADPAGLADAVGERLARLVAERGLPGRGPSERGLSERGLSEPGPSGRGRTGAVTVRLADYPSPGGLEAALAEAIWSSIGEHR